MPVTIEALGIDRLSVREKLDLIEQIWDSLPEQVSADEVPPWHLAELAKRRAEADASPEVGKPWRESLARFGADAGLRQGAEPTTELWRSAERLTDG
jgi:putative addiction module component (TIGR02574 family)